MTLRIELDLPVPQAKLSFDYNFLSTESPDFVGSAYNDTFTATLTDANGTRQIALESVNSSNFFDASDTRAGGTGYDLYVLDPAGIDSDFSAGIGVPDSGVTDFQSVNVDVVGGVPVILELDIRDLGDGILDSSVIVDNFAVNMLEMLDPAHDDNVGLMLPDGTVTGDLAKLALASKHVLGVAADGATQVLVRSRVPDLGNVTFSLAGGAQAPADGGLSALGADDRLNSVTVPALRIASGEYYAFALYRSPADFNRGGDEALAHRPIDIAMDYVPTLGDAIHMESEFTITRPPVVVVPGLWDSCVNWNRPGSIMQNPLFDTTCAAFVRSHADTLAANADMVPAALEEALSGMRQNRRMAVTQADVIGHSMGGILARQHIADPDYRDSLNFAQGDVNRLITMNTPHLGSKLADATEDYRIANLHVDEEGPIPPAGDPAYNDHFIVELANATTAIHLGAVADLKEHSPVLDAIPLTPVPAHALVGSGGKNVPWNRANAALSTHSMLWFKLSKENPSNPIQGNPIAKFAFVFGNGSRVFGSLDHDLFADATSQSGGIAATAITTLSPPAPQAAFGPMTHFASVRQAAYMNRIKELLDTAVTDAAFAEFPAVASVAADPVARQSGRSTSAENVGPTLPVPNGLRIVSPVHGQSVTAGSTVTVEVAPQFGFQPFLVAVIGPDGVSWQVNAPFTIDITIPSDAVGYHSIHAIGWDINDQKSEAQRITVHIQTPAAMTGLRILGGDPILSDIGSTRQITVLGQFDDGIERDITNGKLGTELISSRPDIFTVSEDGAITATGAGIATLVARNGGFQSSVSVTVIGNHRPFADAGADQSVPCTVPGATDVAVALTGELSSDTDGDALSYAWYHNGVEIATGVTATVNLPPGSHTIALIVRDGSSESLPDEVDITISACPSACTPQGTSTWDMCTVDCPCPDGVGDCDSDSECVTGAWCLRDVGLLFGYEDEDVDVCVAGCPAVGTGAPNFCTPGCPCEHGEGDCDNDADCVTGSRCMHDVGQDFGYSNPELDVCVAGCLDIGIGSSNFCTPDCPCDEGEGDCDDNDDCAPGLRCLYDAGQAYGFDPETDVCVQGCPDLGAGADNYCTYYCPCDHGEGDCDSDSECLPGLECIENVGADYGYSANVDVCVLSAGGSAL